MLEKFINGKLGIQMPQIITTYKTEVLARVFTGLAFVHSCFAEHGSSCEFEDVLWYITRTVKDEWPILFCEVTVNHPVLNATRRGEQFDALVSIDDFIADVKNHDGFHDLIVSEISDDEFMGMFKESCV